MEYYDKELELGRLFQWERVDNSEDFIILESRADCRKDILSGKGYGRMVKRLKQIAPDILWKVVLEGDDSYTDRSRQWHVIRVPVEQLTGAQTVFDRFLRGED